MVKSLIDKVNLLLRIKQEKRKIYKRLLKLNEEEQKLTKYF